MKSYNLQGNAVPKVMIMEMCSGINLSCCTKEDQLQIYGQYVQAKEEDRIIGHYAGMKKNYNLLLDTFYKVHGMAEKIIKRQKLKKIGNCKLMSERLVSFDVPTYISQLKELF